MPPVTWTCSFMLFAVPSCNGCVHCNLSVCVASLHIKLHTTRTHNP